jgi:hypothetical protein
MATARTAVRGLSTEDLERIRDSLAAGRKPKVMFTEAAGQIAGQLGQVIELTDPALSEEWVVVRFGRDELPFSPVDMMFPPKNPPARRGEPKSDSKPAPPPAPELMLTKPPVPTPREEQTKMPTATAQTPPAAAKSTKPEAKPDAKPETKPDATPDTTPDGAKPAEARPARKAAKAARPKSPAGLTVTVAYAEGEWTVAANQGTKALAKQYVIRPADALKMVALIDVPGVHEAVEQIVATERAEAEQQAERLRAELAEIESRLADLREAS